MKKSQIFKSIRGEVKSVLSCISPKLETAINYRYVTGQWLNWNSPQDFNAKINWLKCNTYYKNDVVTSCIDKYKIREYLSVKGLSELCPKLYGVYKDAISVNWEDFPNQFAVKCNHGCGMNIIVKDKKNLNIKGATCQLASWLKEDYWKKGEFQYRYIDKRIIVEEYLGDGEALKCYKFYCFNGIPKVAYLSMEEDRYLDYYDMDFNKLPYNLEGHDSFPRRLEKPDTWDSMVEISKVLSEDFPFVRVDLYDAKGKIYISELTFIPTGGYMKIDPPETMKQWGMWLNLPM